MTDIQKLENECDSLEEKLLKIQDRYIKQWTTDEFNTLTKEQLEHPQKIQELINEFSCLQESNVKKLEERKFNLEKLRDELKKIKNETDDIIRNKEEKQSDVDALQKRISSEREALETQNKESGESLSEIMKAVNMHRESLGLRFKKTGGKTQFIFTQINRNDPEEPFFFFVKIEGDERKYTVSDCDPPVSDLPKLVIKLNETKDLKSFVCAMRKRFVQAANKEKSK